MASSVEPVLVPVCLVAVPAAAVPGQLAVGNHFHPQHKHLLVSMVEHTAVGHFQPQEGCLPRELVPQSPAR